MTEIVWTGLEDPTRECCRVDEGAQGVLVESRIDGGSGECSYTLEATAGWEFTRLVLRAGGEEVDVRRLGEDWTVDGHLRPDLRDAREVDISVSPLSNTLPIRRLGLAVGESADIITAYISLPELTVTTDPQRYTRTNHDQYLYESRDSDFRRTVTVDRAGLVIDYPGLFTREDT